MNVVVRNTFLHLSHHSKDEEEEIPEKGRSSSAPSTCRDQKLTDEVGDTASISTRSKTLSTKDSSSHTADDELTHADGDSQPSGERQNENSDVCHEGDSDGHQGSVPLTAD